MHLFTVTLLLVEVLRNFQGEINKIKSNECSGLILRIMNLSDVVNRSYFEKW